MFNEYYIGLSEIKSRLIGVMSNSSPLYIAFGRKKKLNETILSQIL